MKDIDSAIADIREQEAKGEKINFSATAKKWNVLPSTLSRRCRGVTQSREDWINNELKHLTNAQEKVLIKHINYMTDRNIPPTSYIVKNMAEEICGYEVDKNWVGRFVKRYLHELKSGYLRCIANDRAKAEYIPNFYYFFQLVYTSFSLLYLVVLL